MLPDNVLGRMYQAWEEFSCVMDPMQNPVDPSGIPMGPQWDPIRTSVDPSGTPVVDEWQALYMQLVMKFQETRWLRVF